MNNPIERFYGDFKFKHSLASQHFLKPGLPTTLLT